MADNALDHLFLRSSSVVSLNDRFSKALEAPAPGDVKLEAPVEDLCWDIEVRTVQLSKSVPQRRSRVPPPGAARRGAPRPRAATRGGGPPGGPEAPLGSAALEGRLLGGRRCPCALWGLRLLSRRYGWAGKAPRTRPIRRAGFTPNRWKAQFRRKVPSKEVLDRQLDAYMSMSKRRLDAQLDAYMALAGDRDADDDEMKLYDSDCAE